MRRRFLQAKLHKATVTQTDLYYEGSLTVDVDLLEAAGLLPNQAVDVYNINNGKRFTTYLIEGKRGSGVIGVNGAAAHLATNGDLVIVAAYCDLDDDEVDGHQPVVIVLDEQNRPKTHIDPQG